ncbi:MAG: oligopeptide/dipeptide ABC transporter ATP-binding protein [Achromobacter sp.]
MYLGRIIETGPTREILDGPRHPYSRMLRDSSPVPDPAARITLEKIVGEIPAPTHLPSGCTFHPRCSRVRDDCKATLPPLAAIQPGRACACHHPIDVASSTMI